MKFLRWTYLLIALIAVVLLVSCNSQSKSESTPNTVSAAATKPAPKVPQPITAATALQKMQGFAVKQWAADAMPLHIESQPNTEANGQDGKATVWTGVFGSMQRGEVRTFHWSGSLEPDAPASGVSGAAMSSPLTPELSAHLFQSFLLKSDTDKAQAIALEHGGKNILKNDPKQPVKYIVVFDPKTNAPVCYVVYGEDLKKNKGFGAINGLTGNFLHGGKGA